MDTHESASPEILAETVPPVETEQAGRTAPQSEKATPVTAPELLRATETEPVKKRSPYAGLDWSKSNTQLAKEIGKTRQYVGMLRKKRELNPEAFELNAPEPDPEPIPFEPEPAPETLAKDYRASAEMAFTAVTGTAAIIFGPEWQARDDKERQAMVVSIESYMRAKQAPDLSPGWALALVTLAYIAPRLRSPNTSQKLKLGWLWVKDKFSGFLGKRQAPSTPHIQSNSDRG